MHILFCSSEVTPFAKTGGMGDVCGSLPIALEKLGLKVSIILPYYSFIKREAHGIKRLNHKVSLTTVGRDVQVYLVEHEGLFSRPGVYGDKKGDYPDNLRRFCYFCRMALDLMEQLKHKVDIVHCHDWPTALIPVYLKHGYHSRNFYKKTKSMLTIHNLAYQGLFTKEAYSILQLEEKLFG